MSTLVRSLARRAARLLPRLSVPALGLAVLAMAIAVLVLAPEKLVSGRLLDLTYDTLQRLYPRKYDPAAPVRIIDIDEASLAQLGQWPWPRTRLAELTERLRGAGAASIAFDVIFAEPDRTSPTRVAEAWPDARNLRDLLRDLPDHDAVFADAVKGGRVVTGFSLLEGNEEAAGREVPPALKARFVNFGADPRRWLFGGKGVAATLPPIENAAAGNGAVTFVPDADGIIRRVPLILKIGEPGKEKLYPTLAIEAMRVALGVPNIGVRAIDVGAQRGYDGIYTIAVGKDWPIRTDSRGFVWLHFTKPEPARYIPAWKVFANEVDKNEIEGRVIFVGTSAAGLRDLRFSPFGILPGVEVHAELVEQAFGKSFVQRPDWAGTAEMTFLVVVSLLVIVLVTALGAGWSALAVGLAIAGAIAGSWYGFASQRLLLDPLYVSATILTIFLACSVLRHAQEERKGRWIRQAFQSYVSPNLVDHLIANPDQLQLGGERRECSFVLTDLAGFTTVVEGSEPESLVSLMNEYLDEMVGIAFRHDGTLDRIVGDAVAVMFSAPIAQPDHAERAVACALAMDAFSQRFKAQKNAEGVPIGHTRIGVHSGTVIVGNFGGQNSKDYRALGDAINTTARLETVNRHLGTRICVSSAIVERCKNFTGRPVGRLILKGKQEGIEAWEPLPAGVAVTPRVREYMAAFEKMASGAPDAADAFGTLAERYPEDGLARFHAERLDGGEISATVIMTEK